MVSGAALLALWALALATLLGACQVPSLPQSQPRPNLDAEALKPLWEVWYVLHQDYVGRSSLDSQRLSQGAVRGLMKAAGSAEVMEALSAPPTPREPPNVAPPELRPVWDAWVWLHETAQRQAQSLDPPALAQGAIRGLLEALDDRYTAYVPPDRYRLGSRGHDGSYEGIGAEVYERDGRFFLAPMPESPAAKAGLQPGDALLTVDDQPVKGWRLHEVVDRVRGPRGTAVRLEVQHPDSAKPQLLVIQRGVIDLPSVFWTMSDDGIAYVLLGAFYGNTDKAVKQALEEAKQRGARAFILDVRNNPGGYLDTTVNVAGYFLGNKLVVYEVDGQGRRTDHRARSPEPVVQEPLAVLVNQFSASGSEVLAGALQDYQRATVVGMRTFGKGTVNRGRELVDSGGLYYPVSRWHTPSGRLIEGRGLEPDVRVAQGALPGPRDLQLEKALDLLRAQLAQTSPA